MASKLYPIQIRNVVFNMYGQELLANPEQYKKIAGRIQNEIIHEDFRCHYKVALRYCVEYILEHSGVRAFGVEPVFPEQKVTPSVPDILNKLVDSGTISEHWRS